MCCFGLCVLGAVVDLFERHPVLTSGVIVAVLFSTGTVKILIDRKKEAEELAEQQRLLGSSLNDLDCMDGWEFEEWIEAVLIKAGIQAEIPTQSADYGVDVIAKWRGVKFAIQAKRYSKNVGVKAVNEVRAGAEHWDCQVAVIVTQQYFTKQANTLVSSMKIPFILVDRDSIDRLADKIKSHR